MSKRKESIILLSGGIDSATCLYILKARGHRVRALTISYYSISSSEIKAAKDIASIAGVEEHRIVSVPELRELSDIRDTKNLSGLPSTYIPMKNAIFYSIAAAYAEEVGADYIVGGHNKDDKKRFVDTSEEFFSSLQRLLWAGSRILKERGTIILRPIKGKTKAEVVKIASKLGVPFQLTWSCNGVGSIHCWVCDGCKDRIRAFEQANLRDPLRNKNA